MDTPLDFVFVFTAADPATLTNLVLFSAVIDNPDVKVINPAF